MRRLKSNSEREPTTALINIVFLMLIFFLVAGTLAPSLDKNLKLVRTKDLDRHAPADALVVHPDGRLSVRGMDVSDAASYFAELDEDARKRVRVVPDQALPASALVALGRDLRSAGAESVVIVTERGLE
ncbi:ExbD/TolR family protein [Primorskyibacter marinus]|uniref:ExbD/TolR family protein n=1 Tax=Primorskyibacter marinus TaxID=1977320 RepID=UPI000E305F3E|nr:biopolymer transporter ExbD [Primorskyibacter marinus]